MNTKDSTALGHDAAVRATHPEFRAAAAARMRQHIDYILPTLCQDEHDQVIWNVALEEAFARVQKELEKAHLSLCAQMAREQ